MWRLLKTFIALQAVLLSCSASNELSPELEEVAMEQFTLEIGSAIAGEEQRTAECSSSGHRCLGSTVYTGCAGTQAESFLFSCDAGYVCTMSGDKSCIPAPPACTTEGVFRFPGSCDQFYMCVRSGTLIKRFVGTCESGYEFSLETGMCTIPEDAGCSFEAPLPSTTCPTPTPGPSSPWSTTTLAPIGGPVEPAPFVCERRGLFPDATSCRHYYMCVRATPAAGGHFHATRLACPLILPHFNPVTRLCWFFDDSCAATQCGL